MKLNKLIPLLDAYQKVKIEHVDQEFWGKWNGIVLEIPKEFYKREVSIITTIKNDVLFIGLKEYKV